MTDVIDLAARRFAAAKNADGVVVVACLIDEGDDDSVVAFHGGPATKNERIGMLFRAQQMLTPGGVE